MVFQGMVLERVFLQMLTSPLKESWSIMVQPRSIRRVGTSTLEFDLTTGTEGPQKLISSCWVLTGCWCLLLQIYFQVGFYLFLLQICFKKAQPPLNHVHQKAIEWIDISMFLHPVGCMYVTYPQLPSDPPQLSSCQGLHPCRSISEAICLTTTRCSKPFMAPWRYGIMAGVGKGGHDTRPPRPRKDQQIASSFASRGAFFFLQLSGRRWCYFLIWRDMCIWKKVWRLRSWF